MRMLGRLVDRLRQPFDTYDWDRSVRSRKARENRQWRRDIPEEVRPLPDDGDLDPIRDCHHGCNGDQARASSKSPEEIPRILDAAGSPKKAKQRTQKRD